MTFLPRFGAVCGALSGLAIAVPGAIEAFTGEIAPTSVVLGLSPALAAPLVTALFLTQRTDRFARLAYAVEMIGLGLFGAAAFALNVVVFFASGDVLTGPSRLVLSASALTFVVGTVLFAIALHRAGAHPRVPVWSFGIALPVFTLAARLPDTPLTSGLHVVVGATLVWLATSAYAKAATSSTGTAARNASAVTVPASSES
ncbi:hypothetical protein [Actinosynnema sp. NPDC020468]|uniref:hypothetical protein n=1 Tax=Actinosynnema sp. NPDC020468 TaxID=3154488 RepID=UPI0033F65779